MLLNQTPPVRYRVQTFLSLSSLAKCTSIKERRFQSDRVCPFICYFYFNWGENAHVEPIANKKKKGSPEDSRISGAHMFFCWKSRAFFAPTFATTKITSVKREANH